MLYYENSGSESTRDFFEGLEHATGLGNSRLLFEVFYLSFIGFLA